MRNAVPLRRQMPNSECKMLNEWLGNRETRPLAAFLYCTSFPFLVRAVRVFRGSFSLRKRLTNHGMHGIHGNEIPFRSCAAASSRRRKPAFCHCFAALHSAFSIQNSTFAASAALHSALYSLVSMSISSCTGMILSARQAFAPAKAKPFFSLPLRAFIRAREMQ